MPIFKFHSTNIVAGQPKLGAFSVSTNNHVYNTFETSSSSALGSTSSSQIPKGYILPRANLELDSNDALIFESPSSSSAPFRSIAIKKKSDREERKLMEELFGDVAKSSDDDEDDVSQLVGGRSFLTQMPASSSDRDRLINDALEKSAGAVKAAELFRLASDNVASAIAGASAAHNDLVMETQKTDREGMSAYGSMLAVGKSFRYMRESTSPVPQAVMLTSFIKSNSPQRAALKRKLSDDAQSLAADAIRHSAKQSEHATSMIMAASSPK